MSTDNPKDPQTVAKRDADNPDQRPVTINDIARLAGVSKKSISRVLNEEPGISEKTRERIKALMVRYNYAPSRGARALAGSKSFLIALAYDNPNSSYVLELMKGMQSVAAKKRYEIVMLPVSQTTSDPVDVIVSFMRRSTCDGIVLSPPMSELPDIINAFSDESWATVRIAGDDVDLKQPQVRYDDRAAALAVTSHLLDLGHKRIAFVGGPDNSGPTRRRMNGYRDALSIRNIEVEDQLVAWGDFTFATGFGAGQKLLSQDPRPTAIMCANDEMASGVVHAVREIGLRVPDGVSVTGFDDSPLAQQVWPPLSSVRQPVQDMGAAATSMLIETIENKLTGPSLRGFSHELVLRKSSAKPKGAER